MLYHFLVIRPGHTPGHTGYRVGSGPSSVFIWGDIVHVPAVQSALPDAGTAMDVDRAFAVKTRKETFKQAAEEGILIAGMHMEFPGLAQLKSVGDGYRFVAAQWIAQRRISAQEPLEISDDTVVDLSDYREENINVVRKKLRLLAIDHKVHQPSMNSRSYTNCRL